jgi:hypothetical protein
VSRYFSVERKIFLKIFKMICCFSGVLRFSIVGACDWCGLRWEGRVSGQSHGCRCWVGVIILGVRNLN